MNHSFHTCHTFFCFIHLLIAKTFHLAHSHTAKSRQHVHDISKSSKLLHLLDALKIIIKIKLGFFHLLGHLFCFVLVNVKFCFRLLNQRQDISHTENPVCHTIRIKLLQIRKLLAHTDIQNRFSGYCLNG